MLFDWDEAKRKANIRKHGIDFSDAARLLLSNPYVSESRNSGNDSARFIAIGELDGRAYTVIYTLRDDIYRIISARRANNGEKKRYRTLHGKADTAHEE